MPNVRVLPPAEIEGRIPDLAALLQDCVAGGASVSFMAPLECWVAEAFWHGVAAGARRGERVVLVAELDGALVGTAQLILAMPENQRHRAEVAKMLVARHARRRGLGGGLLRGLEATARAMGKTLLTLDTASNSAGEALYRAHGWVAVGSIPHFALNPDGSPCDATFFYKDISKS